MKYVSTHHVLQPPVTIITDVVNQGRASVCGNFVNTIKFRGDDTDLRRSNPRWLTMYHDPVISSTGSTAYLYLKCPGQTARPIANRRPIQRRVFERRRRTYMDSLHRTGGISESSHPQSSQIRRHHNMQRLFWLPSLEETGATHRQSSRPRTHFSKKYNDYRRPSLPSTPPLCVPFASPKTPRMFFHTSPGSWLASTPLQMFLSL